MFALYFLSVIFFCNTALAVEIENLYSAEIEVAGQSSGERKKAVRQALERVMVKLTGHLQSVNSAELAPFLMQAERYVEQFRYKEKEVLSGKTGNSERQNALKMQQDFTKEIDIEPVTNNLTQLYLWVSFDSVAIKNRLDKANIPYWGQTRPLVLVWLAIEEGAERFLLEKELHTDISGLLQKSADFRGLPIAFPLMDLEDRAVIGISDVWGNFADTISEASERYSVDAILVGRLNPVHNAWQGRWTVYHHSRTRDWQSTQLKLADLLKAGIDETTDIIAQDYVQVMSDEDSERLQLVVDGLTNFSEYSQILNYLTGLDLVKNVQVKEVSGTQILLELQTRGSRKLFEQAVQLGRILVPFNGLVSDEDEKEQNDFSLFDVQKEQARETTPKIDLFYRLVL
ncbi:MAG: DUF2066 domain-containing protein [Gammaproteobacteria bacterium]|nr:DUF2066 domain-containing protein [Gammaproteobacteria bacterium]